jgi:integrase
MASFYKRGATWTAHVQYRTPEGKRVQRKIGGFRTKEDARKEANRLERSADLGVAVAPDRITVGQYLEEWLAHREAMGDLKRSTLQSYRNKVRLYLEPALGPIRVQKLTALDLDRTYRAMANRGLSPRSIRYAHSIIHKALHDAERQGVVEHNVARRANPPSSKAARAPQFEVWSNAELARFLAHTDELPHGLALRFAALTGARRGEVCGLRWDDVDLEAGVATIRHNVLELDGGGVYDDTPKNHRERAVALDDGLVAHLRRHRAQQAEWRLAVGQGWRDRGLVFCAPDGDYLRPDVLSRRFRSYAVEAGLPPVRLHDLRHGHGTGLVEAGYDPKTVSSSGHATTQFTLDVYVKPSPERQAEAAQAFADRIARAAR